MAVIGAGHLGRIHARKLAALAGVRLVAVVDPLEGNRRQASEECGAASYADVAEVLGAIDAAVIAVPTRHHHAVGLACLARGIHLLVEKPLASTAQEADELVAAARKGRALLQVGHVERFNPALAAAWPHIRGPRFIEASRFGVFSGRSTDIGAVLDLMIHDIDLALALVRSEVREVEALGVSVLGRHEDAAHARLTFANGALAVLSASRVSYAAERWMRIWSPGAFASVDFATRSATIVRPGPAVAEGRFDIEALPMAERLALKDRLFDDLLPIERPAVAECDPITAELEDFRDSIRQLRAPRVSGEQGAEAIRVAEQVLAAIDAGSKGGPTVPLPRRTVPAPHWDRRPAPAPPSRREAG
jgi:predicted dehydrogenase